MATNSKTPVANAERPLTNEKTVLFVGKNGNRDTNFLAEDLFHTTLTLERHRAERSRKPFVLMLLDAREENGLSAKLLHRSGTVLMGTTRETDLLGWYKKDSILGVIFTELGSATGSGIVDVLKQKVRAALEQDLGVKEASKIFISLHLFPETSDEDRSSFTADSKLYPDLLPRKQKRKVLLGVKRLMDVAGSGMLLLLLSPLLAGIALIIKLTSQGPVLFEQERLGQFGKRFKCLKFRTMYVNSDSKIHQEYIQKFINGKADSGLEAAGSEAVVYKITSDPRVTPFGRFLRKASLDEIPQFWNVLRGEMSLVGPRPPLPYEYEIYDIWHRRRVLELKPGITGLWQVSGRSRSRFDDMVRLDLRYSQYWSLWLDVKILAATPWVVLSGDGAY